ncbi:hypothetical protein HAX54_048759 [Datura stramonium]|uniref:Uncharacterized protein n=1 Tax=Datura stramonium TaxID=4076 RepID=A0ABS8WLR8_DATST|nr:hypothetical protein [Datura stramonium]
MSRGQSWEGEAGIVGLSGNGRPNESFGRRRLVKSAVRWRLEIKMGFQVVELTEGGHNLLRQLTTREVVAKDESWSPVTAREVMSCPTLEA